MSGRSRGRSKEARKHNGTLASTPPPQVGINLFDPFNWFDEGKDKARGRQVEINNGRLAMLGIFSLLSESAAPGAVPPLTLVNYIVDASGLTELNFPSIDLPVIGTVGGWAFLNSFPQYTPPADLSIVTAVSQFSTPGNALLGAVGN